MGKFYISFAPFDTHLARNQLGLVHFIVFRQFLNQKTKQNVCVRIMELNGTWLAQLKLLKEIYFKSATSLSRNHDPLTQDNPQSFLRKVSCRNQYSKKKPKVILQYEKIKNYFSSACVKLFKYLIWNAFKNKKLYMSWRVINMYVQIVYYRSTDKMPDLSELILSIFLMIRINIIVFKLRKK